MNEYGRRGGLRSKQNNHRLLTYRIRGHITQDFDGELEQVVKQVQQASFMPVTTYAGTSLTTDSFLEYKWNESSQSLWSVTCVCGKEHLPLVEAGVMDMIQPQGPSCIKCSRLLDMRNGFFVHQNQRMLEMGHFGYHIPQIIVPNVYLNPTRWAEIYKDKHRNYIKFLQENLGIATEEGQREITKQHLIDMCTLGDPFALQLKAKNKKYVYVVSGCDWGGSDYNPMTKTKLSTTVHAMAGVTTDNQVELIHFRRYSGMDYDDIVGDILQNHTNLNGFAIASDFGVGAVYNSKIRERMSPDKHLIFNYTGPDAALITDPKNAHMYNQWSLNKTESISLTYDAVRTQRIKCFNWEYAQEYLMDFLNMYRAPGEKLGQTGATTFLYRPNPSKANDALQAVNYAFMLAKILIGEPMFADMTVKLAVENALRGSMTYAPGKSRVRAISR